MYRRPDIEKDFIKDNQPFYEQLENDCRYSNAAPKSLDLSKEDKINYADAVITAAVELLHQNPKAVFLPARGGVLHGKDITYAAWMIADKIGIDYDIKDMMQYEASGIGAEENVGDKVREELTRLKRLSEESPMNDLPALDEFTVIDSAYTGMAYSKLIGIFEEVFPDSRINGIVLRDNAFDNDDIDSRFKSAHARLNNGDFISINVKLPWEDEDIYFHNIADEKTTQTIFFPRLDYYEAQKEIMDLIIEKIESGVLLEKVCIPLPLIYTK